MILLKAIGRSTTHKPISQLIQGSFYPFLVTPVGVCAFAGVLIYLLMLLLPFQSKGLRPEALWKYGDGRTSTPLHLAVRYMKPNVFLVLFRAHLGASTSSPSAAAAARNSSSDDGFNNSLLQQTVKWEDENGQIKQQSVRQWAEKGCHGWNSASCHKNVCQLLETAESGESDSDRWGQKRLFNKKSFFLMQ